jgi:DNA modification methylase
MGVERVEIGPCVLYRGDALEVSDDLPDLCADACVMDPPYCAGAISEAQRTRSEGQGLRSENLRRFGWFVGDNMGTAGLICLLRCIAVQCNRVVKPTGSLLTFCDWRMMSAIQPAIESAGLRFQNLIVWDKGSMGLGSGFRCQHELILHFTFGSPEYFDRGTGNVIYSQRVLSAEREHQAQKPADLIRALVEVVSPPRGKVLDPFMGCGTAAEVCIQSGREFIGIERDPATFETACRRIERAVKDQKDNLFPVTSFVADPPDLFAESPCPSPAP